MKTTINLADWNMGEGVVNFNSFSDVLNFVDEYNWEVEDVLDVLDIDIETYTMYEDCGVSDYVGYGSSECHDSIYGEFMYEEAKAFGETLQRREDWKEWVIAA